MLRTNTCGELRATDKGKEVTLCGWVHSRRDHGGIIFIDVRDRYGLTQIVFDPKHNAEAHTHAEHLGREFVVQAQGHVRHRGQGLVNPHLPTGEIEVIIDTLTILNPAQTPPLEIDDRKIAHEDVRLKYRYLDLRRPQMQKHLLIRHKAMVAAMKYLDAHQFVHVTTPMLMKSTPEGARDYVVPSRVNPGKFYALPQSPQLYKQLLQIAGVDRYFQFAICLRDEDLRADRQPEHMQIDLEMSFVELEDLWKMFEGLIKAIFESSGMQVTTPFSRIRYTDAMNIYGTDKPDLRYDLPVHDITSLASQSDFSVFKSVVDKGGVVKCIACQSEKFSRTEIEKLIDLATRNHAGGLAWMKYDGKKLESNIAKFFSEKLQHEIVKTSKAKPGDILFFVADEWSIACRVMGVIRQAIAEFLDIIPKSEFKFCWVSDFPLFEWNLEEKRWDPAHHMFCMPKLEHLQFLESDPGKVYCTQYDLALNGVELGSGSLRINRSDIQERVMKVIGLSMEELREKFGFFVDAFAYGAPPHGGIGLGFDRIIALMCGFNDIREVIAFPKNKSAQNPMDGCPSTISEKQWKELSIKTTIKK